MKHSTLCVLALALLTLASCKLENVSLSGGRRVEPSADVVKREYRQPAFTKVDVDVVANVKFIQSAEGDYRVVLSAPSNYVELFSFTVDEGELEVAFAEADLSIDPKHVDVTVYAPKLEKLENEGVANIEVDRLTADRLKLENSGVGSLYASGLVVGSLEVECSGVGNVELGGQADRAELECSGVGSIKAQRLVAKTVRAEVSGVGGVRCHATEAIEGEVSGVGSLKYGGHPQTRRLSATGVGKISEL